MNMQMLNAINTTRKTQSYISHLARRGTILVVLLFAFVVGAVAQEMPNVPKTGRRDGVVYLNDLEDHRWTYYSGINPEVDPSYVPNVDGYNKKYSGKLYSPNPRNVMITYNGVNDVEGSSTSVKVSIDNENETSFVYYKTFEQGATEEEYPYTVISNPFSVRPSVGLGNNKVYYGFNGWKIMQGYQYIKRANGNMAKENDILNLDEEITFINLPYNTINCISAEIVLQTTWVPLNNILHHSSTSTGTYNYTAEGGNYETNIIVLTSNINRHIISDSPCTVTMVEPDGSADYRNGCKFSKLLRPVSGASNRTKIEFVNWEPSGDINARGRNFTIGRGIVMSGTEQALYGTQTASEDVNQILKVESGNFLKFENYGATPSKIVKQCVIFGNDYDRAQNENQNLKFEKKMCVAYSTSLPTPPSLCSPAAWRSLTRQLLTVF